MYLSIKSKSINQGSRVAQWSKTLLLNARGVTVVPGLNPGCIPSGCDWESHKAAHNWPSVAGVGRHFKEECVLNGLALLN